MERSEESIDQILAKLEKVKDPVRDNYNYYCYQGFWIQEVILKRILSFPIDQFVAQDDDILLTSCPKSGTTWLQSLVFSIVKRNSNSNSNNPLISSNPHDLIHPLELSLNDESKQRIMFTHFPYSALPPSIKHSKCKIIYICRNPLDLFISHWHFVHQILGDVIEPNHLEECFDMFCKGIHAFGPFWEHILGFWKASLEMPDRILFLKYEELKKDNVFFIEKIANFLGFPFSTEEENRGVPKEIEKMCSFENMKNVDVNKTSKHSLGMSNSSFFRKGEIGDWVNYLTPEMAEIGKKLIEEKFGESGLMFDF
ncbi:hypothetical protein F8388_024538 [Cannabis sativa]|uniref:Sulfotransferase n=1 Tax=Cannabis sativa TaxID=3483 RepID=A0A7J6GBB7_CANSA|nr:hypothetical protein F8388_024538 [Cannabis sativa]